MFPGRVSHKEEPSREYLQGAWKAMEKGVFPKKQNWGSQVGQLRNPGYLSSYLDNSSQNDSGLHITRKSDRREKGAERCNVRRTGVTEKRSTNNVLFSIGPRQSIKKI